MQLLVAHQILIGSAIALALIFGVRAMAHYARAGAPADLAITVASVVLTGLLAMYFRKVRAKWREQRAAGRRG